jgi:oxazoline/thiazoline synthase
MDTEFVEKIYNLTLPMDCPFFVTAAIMKPDFTGKRRFVSGRGVTPQAARQSCLAESAERWCAIYSEAMPTVWASEDELGAAGITPHSLLMISERQFNQVDKWNREVAPEHYLPTRRASSQTIGWIEAYSITRNEKVLVPMAHCILGYPLAREQGFPVPDSSGLAAGKQIETCVETGLLELIERDATSIWWYNRIPRPPLRVDRENCPLLADFEGWVERCGRKLRLLDLTTDLGVPVAAGLSCNREGRDLSFGFSAGWTKEAACYGALGELIQFEVTKHFHQKKSGRSKSILSWCVNASEDDHRFLQPAISKQVARTLKISNISKVIDELQQKGIEVIILVLVKPNMHSFAVRVLAPGLRHIAPRFGPGRLYDVPVALGWQTSKLREDELNPTPFIY